MTEAIIYTNAQSLLAHREEFQHQILMKTKPAILALSETRLISDIEDKEVNMPGYNTVRCDAESRNTGGVILYVRSNIKYEVVLIKKLISNCWCAAIKVWEDIFKGIIIIVVYHSPSASDGDFIRFLEDVVEQLVIKGECIVIGDLNIDLMLDTFYARKLRTTMLSLGIKQFVDGPTRITKNSRTLTSSSL